MENKTVCQSCSSPIKEDNSNRASAQYCTLCFKDGEFIYPDITLERMEELVFEEAQRITNYPKFMIKMHVKTIKNLDRWRK